MVLAAQSSSPFYQCVPVWRSLEWSFWSIQTIASLWSENMLGYLFADIICSEKRTVFQEHSSRKTVSFEEQIMSKDKISGCIFFPNGGYFVYYSLNLFLNAHSFENWGIFSHIPQFKAGENSVA